MQPFSLSPDDLPSPQGVDRDLLWELEDVISQYFYQSCDVSLQTLLSQCGWRLTRQGNALTLSIFCATQGKNWQVLKHLSAISYYLAQFSESAQICLYPPPETDTPWMIRVAEGIYFSG